MKLVETVSFEGAEFVEENGVRTVRNVAMLGPESSHGYGYRQGAMGRAVKAGLYEGVRIFINHAKEGRNLMEMAGVFRGARHEGGKVRGNAHLLDDAYGRKFWDIAKNMPEAAGCSHVADGKLVRGDDGKNYVEEITRVYSVDLVVEAATTASVFEGETLEEGVPRPAKKELQYQFIPRCIRAMQANNKTLTDEEAGAACFSVWQSRYEDGGMLDVDLAPAPAAESHNQENVTITRAEEPRKESAMKTINEEIREHDEQIQQIASLASHEDITRRHQQEDDHRAYEERCEQTRRDAGKAATIAESAANRGHESDEEFSQRLHERRKTREAREREAKRIAEQVLPVGGDLVG